MSETVNIVAKAICEALFGPYEQEEADRSEYSVSGQSVIAARAVLEALGSLGRPIATISKNLSGSNP